LARWFAGAVPDAGSELSADLITGGRSNLTYRVSDGDRSWVLRRPPLGHVLATAHDMNREFRVMSALAATAVPVPRMVAFCDDESVLGAPFYVMEDVDGTPYRLADELRALGPRRTRTISTRLVDTLATLAAVDPRAVGLADFGRPEGFLARQVERWRRQFDASRSRELPAADELHSALARTVPPESAIAVVHGDFRLDNVLVDASDRPVAVIDWEMATLGDPLTDLALMVVYARLGALLRDVASDVATAPGYLSEHETLERYTASTGHALPEFGWYVALASYKLAAIVAGIHVRHIQGKTVGDGFDDLGTATEPLLEAGLAALKGQA